MKLKTSNRKVGHLRESRIYIGVTEVYTALIWCVRSDAPGSGVGHGICSPETEGQYSA